MTICHTSSWQLIFQSIASRSPNYYVYLINFQLVTESINGVEFGTVSHISLLHSNFTILASHLPANTIAAASADGTIR